MVSGGIGEDFGKDHLIFRGNGGNQSSPTEYIGRDYRKMTPIGGGVFEGGFLGGSHDFQGERRGISRR